MIQIAASVDDDEWLYWAWTKAAEMNNELDAGYDFEMENTIVRALIQAYVELSDLSDDMLNPKLVNIQPVRLSAVVDIVRKTMNVSAKTVAEKLRKLGVNTVNRDDNLKT
jgi:hypothetical protein